jgi:hypothetical protein
MHQSSNLDKCGTTAWMVNSSHPGCRYVKNLPGATGGAGEGPTNLGDGYDGPGNKKISDTLADSTWLYVYPEGFGELLKYVNKKCAPNPP